MLTGTCCRFSVRFCAVTMISSSDVACCACAGDSASITAEATGARNRIFRCNAAFFFLDRFILRPPS